LQWAEYFSLLQRAAIKGTLDAHVLFKTILNLSEALPQSEVADNLVDALKEVLKKALKTYDREAAARVTTKSRPPKSTIDTFGRGRDKPYWAEEVRLYVLGTTSERGGAGAKEVDARVEDAAESLDTRIEDEDLDGRTEAVEVREALERLQALSLEVSEGIDTY
jgi:hypothetical protein